MDKINIGIVKCKPNAIIPTQKHNGDAGWDLYSTERIVINPFGRALVPTGIKLSIPRGWYGRIAPRSGMAFNNGIDVMAGVIDHSYTGEVGVLLINLNMIGEVISGNDAQSFLFGSKNAYTINPGDKIAQIIFEKIAEPEFEILSELNATSRGAGGFGSTGK